MFGFFNIWKNPLLLNPVLNRAHKEINKAIANNQKLHQNHTIFMKVDVSPADNLPHIHVVDEEGKVYEEMLFKDLLNDPELQKQLDSIPNMIRKKIDLDKILAKINRAIGKALGSEQYAKVVSGNPNVQINFYKKDGNTLSRRDVSLKDLLDADKD